MAITDRTTSTDPDPRAARIDAGLERMRSEMDAYRRNHERLEVLRQQMRERGEDVR